MAVSLISTLGTQGKDSCWRRIGKELRARLDQRHQRIMSRACLAAYGRKRPLISAFLAVPERPLSEKADINIESLKIGWPNVRFAPGSGH